MAEYALSIADGIGPHVGQRERNRQRIRSAIRDAARELFVERGFDGASVAEVARRAGVTEKTVFNHFPTKEDLVYSEMENWEGRMVASIRDRPPGRSVLDAFQAFVSEPSGLLAGGDADRDELAGLVQLVLDTPALRAREAETFARYTDALAEVFADELGTDPGDPQAWILANAMMGVHRALLTHVRRGIVAGRSSKRLVADVRRLATEACTTLGNGIKTIGTD